MSDKDEANAAFIAAAREGVPMLCDEVMHLADQRARCGDMLKRLLFRLTESSHDLREIDEELAEEVRALLAELDSAGRA